MDKQNETPWTPGPWEIEARVGHSSDGQHRPVICHNSQRVAVVSRAGAVNHSEEAMNANARLISSAPELYAALFQAKVLIGALCRSLNDERGGFGPPEEEAHVQGIRREIDDALKKARAEG